MSKNDGINVVMCESPVKHTITARELREVVLNERKVAGCYSLSCDDCKWNDECLSCDYLIIADYVNKIKR